MREINNNNVEIGKVQKPEVKTEKVQDSASKIEPSENAEIKDFSNPTEILGRSQVNKTDSLQEDVSFSIKNPDVVESANKFFDIAYAQLAQDKDPEAYEKAATMATIYVKEITNKSH